MAGREYQGAGGLRLHLDEPYFLQMADQIAKGQLVPVDDTQAEPAEESSPSEGASASAAEPQASKPNANSKVDDWRAYAVSLGMPEEDAAGATKKDCQEYVQVVEDAADNGSQE